MLKVAGVGAALGFLGAVGIYFAPSSLGQCLGWGAAMGLLASASVFLAKGGWTSWDAPFVVPTGIVTGAILGPAIRWLRRRAT